MKEKNNNRISTSSIYVDLLLSTFHLPLFTGPSLRPDALDFTLEVIPGPFEVGDHFDRMRLVSNFEHQFDSDLAQRCEPEGATVKNIDDVGFGFGDAIHKLRQRTGAIHNRQF